MKSPRRAAGGAGDAGQPRLFREWIGGRLSPPLIIEGPSEPYRPYVVIWVEFPEGVRVGQGVVAPRDAAGSVACTLRSGRTQPMVETPSRPDLSCVADAAMVADVRAEVNDRVAVTVAATPEHDELLEHMVATMPPSPSDDGSHRAAGRVSSAAVKKLHAANRALFAVKPWAPVLDLQVLRVDVPALDVEGACASVVGGDERRGMPFPSGAHFDGYLEDVATGLDDGSPDLGTEVLSVTSAAATGLPSPMRREAMKQGSPMASPDAYARLQRLAAHGTPRALVEREVEVTTACALALSAFFARHTAVFKSGTSAPVCESYFDDDDRQALTIAPCEAQAGIDPPEDPDPDVGATLDPAPPAEPSQPRVSRSDPCACGGGQIHRRCHLAADERATGENGHVTAPDDRARRLVVRLTLCAPEKYGETWRGRSVAEMYRDASGRRCSRAERRWR